MSSTPYRLSQGNTITIGDTQPEEAVENDAWLDTANEVWKLYKASAWVTISGGVGVHQDLPDTDNYGHPGSAIQIQGGTPGNAVVIDANGFLEDGGTPP